MTTTKLIIMVFTLMVFSQTMFAQDCDIYLQKAQQRLEEGDCEGAQRSYNVYKELSGQINDELETQIKDCFNEGKTSWREEEVRSEILMMKVNKTYSFYKSGQNNPPSEMEVYNRVLSDIRKDYPNRMIGIQEGSGTICGMYKGWWFGGVLRDDYTDYTCNQEFEILEPNIRYYLNEAIRSANDGSRIALNQVLFMEGTDERLENQLMDILFDEGFRVVNSISNADYYINVKMEVNSLQIRMVNAVTGDYEGVSSVKYDGFIDEIKIGKGGECINVEKPILLKLNRQQ